VSDVGDPQCTYRTVRMTTWPAPPRRDWDVAGHRNL